jgi:hypothetical protein
MIQRGPSEFIRAYLDPGEQKVLLDINWSRINQIPKSLDSSKIKLISFLVKSLSKLQPKVPNYYIPSSLEKSLGSILKEFALDPSHNHTLAYITFMPFMTAICLPEVKELMTEAKNILSKTNATELRIKTDGAINSGNDFTVSDSDLIRVAQNAMIQSIRNSDYMDVLNFYDEIAENLPEQSKKFLNGRFWGSLFGLDSKAKLNPNKQFTVLLHNYLFFYTDFSVYTSDEKISPIFFEFAFSLLSAHELFENDIYAFKERFRKYL